jgi:hypothetical protein
MAIKDKEKDLAEQIKNKLKDAYSKQGLTPNDKAIEGLSTGIAEAIIPFLIDNLEVLSGIPVEVTAGTSGSTSDVGKVT